MYSSTNASCAFAMTSAAAIVAVAFAMTSDAPAIIADAFAIEAVAQEMTIDSFEMNKCANSNTLCGGAMLSNLKKIVACNMTRGHNGYLSSFLLTTAHSHF